MRALSFMQAITAVCVGLILQSQQSASAHRRLIWAQTGPTRNQPLQERCRALNSPAFWSCIDSLGNIFMSSLWSELNHQVVKRVFYFFLLPEYRVPLLTVTLTRHRRIKLNKINSPTGWKLLNSFSSPERRCFLQIFLQ